jgi:hypothetical protein
VERRSRSSLILSTRASWVRTPALASRSASAATPGCDEGMPEVRALQSAGPHAELAFGGSSDSTLSAGLSRSVDRFSPWCCVLSGVTVTGPLRMRSCEQDARAGRER